MQEIFSFVKYENTIQIAYQVSNLGKLRETTTKREVETIIDKKGNVITTLKINKKNVSVQLAYLVANTFIANPDNCIEVEHIDGNKENNVVTNLKWVVPNLETVKEEVEEVIQEEQPTKTVKTASNKLTEGQVRYIRDSYREEDGTSNKNELATELGVSETVIMNVVNRKTYKNVE